MIEDTELLRRYSAEKSEAAFAELVHRRVDLVYSVALRQVGGDAHLAQDVTQKVFTDLARKASTLLDRPVLSGWLYRSAQFAASDLVRSERRRRAREQEHSLMTELTSPADPATDWDRIRPLLDEAMGELNDPDRDAIALRFFEGRAFADVGRTLRLTEEAARKRVDRALDKLAGILSRRGVTSTTAAIGTALAHQAAVAAPAGLAASVTGSAMAAAGGVAAAAGIFSFMSSTTITASAGAVAALAVGAVAYEATQVQKREAELAALGGQAQALQAKIAAIETRAQAAERRAADAEEDSAKLLSAIQSQSAARAAASTASTRPMAALAGSAAESEPLTFDTVQARYRRAQEMARNGDPAEALRELLWCFDTGMPPIAGFGGVRVSFLLSDIAKLGERHPAALDALRERRDKAEKRLLASETDYEATQTLSSINRVLKENARSIALLDQLPAGDRRRTTLAMNAFDDLREMQRYADAAQGITYSQMTLRFETSTTERPLPPGIKDPDRIRKAQRDYAITSTANNIEVLAGSGDLEHARALAARVFAFDGSPETRAIVQKHVERAGQPDLLRGQPKG